jgi:nicotinamidase/pyrazinamidase
MTELPYGMQILWPDHCIQGTSGAALADALDIPRAELVIRKGYHGHTDSYSGFMEADRRTRTGLAGYLRERGIERVFCAGLATDFCVSWTALDAREAGFESYVVEDASRGIDTGGSMAAALAAWERAGVRRIRSSEIQASSLREDGALPIPQP